MASKLHNRVKRLLGQIVGKSQIREEVNVKKLFPTYGPRDQHYDLIISTHQIVIECHGEQHRSLQSFGQKDMRKVIAGLSRQKRRDRAKENIAWENNWGYMVIWYDELPEDDTIAIELLKTKVFETIEMIEDE